MYHFLLICAIVFGISSCNSSDRKKDHETTLQEAIYKNEYSIKDKNNLLNYYVAKRDYTRVQIDSIASTIKNNKERNSNYTLQDLEKLKQRQKQFLIKINALKIASDVNYNEEKISTDSALNDLEKHLEEAKKQLDYNQ
jgi:hypothetical protein